MGVMFSFLRALVGVSPARPALHFGGRQSVVKLRSGGDAVSMEEFLNTHVPSLLEPYKPAWWLPTGHGQTVYCVLGDFTKHDHVRYERKMLRLADGGTVGLDFTVGHEKMPEDAPIIVVKHGLTGGSYESYVRAILARACASLDQGGLGMRGVVCNFRGCAGTPVTSAQFYSAGHTDDLRVELSFIRHLYPKAPLIGMGFSLGANVVTRYLAEEGEQSLLIGGIVLACPWDLLDNSKHLHAGFLSNHVYSKAMAKNLINVFRRHAGTFLSLPPSPQLDHLKEQGTIEKVLDKQWAKGKTLCEVDEIMVANLGGSFAPHGPFPFPGAREYYIWASSHHVLPGVRVPLLAINAADDPVVVTIPTDCGANAHVCVAVTHTGGHLGWFEDDGRRWVVRPALEYLRALRDDVDGPLRPGRALIVDGDGLHREEGREHIGWRLLKDGEVVVAKEGATGLVAGL